MQHRTSAMSSSSIDLLRYILGRSTNALARSRMKACAMTTGPADVQFHTVQLGNAQTLSPQDLVLNRSMVVGFAHLVLLVAKQQR